LKYWFGACFMGTRAHPRSHREKARDILSTAFAFASHTTARRVSPRVDCRALSFRATIFA